MLGRMGFDSSALRFVPSYTAHEEWGLLGGFFRRGRQMFLSASILVALIMASVMFLFRANFSDELVFIFMVGRLLLPVLVALQVYGVI